MQLPGIVGSGALWLRGCQQVQEVYETGEWLVVEGEPGVGKLALLRAVHQRRDPSGRFSVLDAAEATSQDWLVRARHALLDGEGDLVIRHIDRLTARQAHFLASALQEARAAGQPDDPAGGGHQDPGDRQRRANLTELLRSFPRTVALPPLRHHVEDLPELVRFFMGKLSQHGRLTCSPEAMQLLARSTWPGNIEQLWQVMRRIVAAQAGRLHRARGPAARVLDGQPPPAQPAGGAGARRDRAEPAGLGRQQGQGGRVARHVQGDDLPQDPRLRHRHPRALIRRRPWCARRIRWRDDRFVWHAQMSGDGVSLM